MAAVYKNHHTLKKNRLVALKRYKGMCAICLSRATHVHHIDETKDNHEISNLLPVCNPCHRVIHDDGEKKTSKFIRKYGYSADKIRKIMNHNSATIYKLEKTSAGDKKIKDAITKYKELEKI